MQYTCESCYKDYEADWYYAKGVPMLCPECKEKFYRYGGYKVKCADRDCRNEFYVPMRAHKTVLCPECRYYQKKEKARERKRAQREREKMSRLQKCTSKEN